MFRDSTWIVPMILVTSAYLVCFYATFLIILPFQNAVFGTIPVYASLLYLPHGVRVLVARFYGWKAVLFLTPATLQTHYYISGWKGGAETNLISVGVSILCAPLSFWIFEKVKNAVGKGAKPDFDWRSLLIVGVMASLINAMALNMYHSDLAPSEILRAFLAYLIGDISGQFFLMFLLMMSFRWARKLERA
ncbi:hypothetical protein [Falsihalocynthiibacter arcticus]|uniref:MASE1 domain-containing protein n=1 Tax=Falsihalocynthiibacter arcticus TaxID=1579316 RepID=A0A126UW90_9RHOB|nr:hypothetical protein [Falsihalocynthiibacter arcticus]AML50147.1 hypothetical protein RC74_01665 [Falsihalocynthiibacter arcticus]